MILSTQIVNGISIAFYIWYDIFSIDRIEQYIVIHVNNSSKHVYMAIWTCLLGLFSFMTMYFSILSMLDILHHIMMQSILIGSLG